jgi:FkbM family methyltransferase
VGDLKRVDNWIWPASDTECQKVAHDISALKEAMGYCTDFRCAIQAGGNVGIWPAKLAEKFEAVYTAEPDADNFACLSANVTAPNVYKFQCGLGVTSWPAELHSIDGNCGAGFLGGKGHVPILTIDSLSLLDVDLIALDIEGMELQALRGGQDTIRRFRPVILLEQKGHGQRYGYKDEQIEEFLKQFGYRVKTRVARDVIYVHGVVK